MKKSMNESYNDFVTKRKEKYQDVYVPTIEEFTDFMLKLESINTIPDGVTIQIEKGKKFRIIHDEWAEECFLTSEQNIGFNNINHPVNHARMFMCRCCPDLYAVLSWGKGLDLIVKWEDMTLCFPETSDIKNVLDANFSDRSTAKSTSTIQ